MTAELAVLILLILSFILWIHSWKDALKDTLPTEGVNKEIDMEKCSFEINFVRKATKNETASYKENGIPMIYDSTEFDVDSSSTDSTFTELFNLFYIFINENKFENVKILCTDEVAYYPEN